MSMNGLRRPSQGASLKTASTAALKEHVNGSSSTPSFGNGNSQVQILRPNCSGSMDRPDTENQFCVRRLYNICGPLKHSRWSTSFPLHMLALEGDRKISPDIGCHSSPGKTQMRSTQSGVT